MTFVPEAFYNASEWVILTILNWQIRIQNYSTTPLERLNEDQVRSLKTLPVLEGIHKELDEVKKAVEVGSFWTNHDACLRQF